MTGTDHLQGPHDRPPRGPLDRALDLDLALDLDADRRSPRPSLTHLSALWCAGRWRELAALADDAPRADRSDTRPDATSESNWRDSDDAGLIAALIASAKMMDDQIADNHINDIRTLIREALAGASPDHVARILLASAYGTRARMALIERDEAAGDAALEQVFDIVGVAHTDQKGVSWPTLRKVREATSLGLLMASIDQIDRAAGDTSGDTSGDTGSPAQSAAMATILRSEIRLIKMEMQLALKRGQMQSGPHTQPRAGADDLTAMACSQLGQDIWVLQKTGYKHGGFFVEFGATDGVSLSNTMLLETRFGWRGLLAEPNPEFLSDLKKNRQATISDACIAGETGRQVEFIFADVFGGIAQFAGEDAHSARRDAYRQQVKNVSVLTTISLNDFLTQHNAPRQIDYISVDTEGSEYDILRTFPFTKWDVALWTIEHNFTPLRDKIYALMRENGYERQEAQFDDWYFKP